VFTTRKTARVFAMLFPRGIPAFPGILWFSGSSVAFAELFISRRYNLKSVVVELQSVCFNNGGGGRDNQRRVNGGGGGRDKRMRFNGSGVRVNGGGGRGNGVRYNGGGGRGNGMRLYGGGGRGNGVRLYGGGGRGNGMRLYGGGGRDCGSDDALAVFCARTRIASQRIGFAMQLGREHSIRGGSELHLP